MASPGWTDFLKATIDQPHHELLERAAARFERPGRALDLGCGAGRDTRFLLEAGWRVTAVDGEAEAIALLARLPHQDRLAAIHSTFEAFAFEPAAHDLISAQYSLPFIPPPSFRPVIARLKQALRPGGVFAGQFFGDRDEWNTPDTAMTFLTRSQVDELLGDLRVHELTEEDQVGETAVGGSKRWHVFHVIAEQRA